MSMLINPTSSQAADAPLQPPVANKVHTERMINGHKLVDDYAWLRDKSNPEVAAALEAENAYADAVMKPTDALQKRLYDEMVSHIKETDTSVPYKRGEYYYYNRTEQGKQYPILCRKKGSVENPEEIMLDVNELAKGEAFMALGTVALSEDGTLLAYSTDNTGFRQYRLHVKDLRTGKLLPDTVEKTGSIVWANDNQTLFYTVEDHAKRQYRFYRHKLGTETASDPLVYEEKDERFNLGVSKTRSRQFLFLESASHTTSEIRFLTADAPTAEWKLVAPRQDNIEYYADHRGDLFYIRVNDTGRNFRLVMAPLSDPAKRNWKELVAHRTDVMLVDIDLFNDFYVRSEREGGLPRLIVTDFASRKERAIRFPEPAYSAFPESNAEFKASTFRYAYQSLVTPNSVFDYDTTTHESKLLKQDEVPGGFDRANYQSERVFATASDGVKVPISIVYRRDRRQPGKNPLYVYAYGSYGYTLPITFSPVRLSLLDRGVVMAYAHIRGGGDMGKPWHDQGRMMNKLNTFTDFIVATEYLVANKYGAADKVAIEGGSAGGLLMGAVSNMRPDLFRAVVSHVPFVDVMNTMLDPTLPLTIPEYEEWGNPNEKTALEYMLRYSPYDNLEHKAYPAMLVKTSFNDSQVMYWEPAKYVAKLRTLKTDRNVLLLKTNMAAGHGGASGRYDHLQEIAFDYAFILTQLGVEKAG